MTDVPARSEIVIIGGGVIGCSIAYHLARRGKTDVTLIERRRLTEGSTWHAAGLIGQLRSSSSLTTLMRASVSAYQALELQTGYATGWHQVGSIRIASSDDRWHELKRLITAARSFGFDAHLISAETAGELFPPLCLDGVRGAVWVPSDGYADPSQLTHSFATGARALGVRIIENCEVTGFDRAGRRVTALVTPAGRIECDTVVNATGMWGAQTAALAGSDLAVSPVEHQYVVTDRIEGLPADLPTLRDPDARFYVKPEGGGLAIGGWEDGSRVPWRPIPPDLGPELFPPAHDRFAPLAEGCAHRIPASADVGIRTWVNGPIPFSPDAEPLMGLTEDLDNLFHCCGFSAGIAAAGGAGHAMAGWIIDGDPGLDLWAFDVRRFGLPHSVPGYLALRCVDAYANYYQVAFPNREPAVGRGQRRSPLHDVLGARGAVFGAKFGWERPGWFAPVPGEAEEPGFGRGRAWPRIEAEHHAVRQAAGLIDMSSFSKFEITGPGALSLLQRLAGADLDVRTGKIVYTQLLNERGGIEADVTITRLGATEFYLVTGAGFGRHDIAFVLRHAPDDGSVTVRDVTSAFGVLTLTGPQSRLIAQRISSTDLSGAAFAYMTARWIDLGHAPALALRAGYVGELGWEFHVPAEYVRDLYDRLHDAGTGTGSGAGAGAGETGAGLRDIGYRAVNSLRLEKHYLAWAADVRSDDNPYAAGLGAAVRADKPGLLAGPALRKIRDSGPAERLCWFSADLPATGHTASSGVTMYGGELLTHPDYAFTASVRSAGFGYTIGRTIFSAYLPAAAADATAPAADATAPATGQAPTFEIEVAAEHYPATRQIGPPYDPSGSRIRA